MKKSLVLTGLILGLASMGRAQFGGVVVVAANPAQEALWAAEELPKWMEMINTAQRQVEKAKEMVDVVGHPEKFAARIVDLSCPALESTALAKSLQSDEAVMKATRDTWKLYSSSSDLKDGVLSVGKSYRVFGKEVSRHREKYVRLAVEKSLRNRLKEAIKNKRSVDSAELALQQKALASVRGAQTQTEIALAQATITASQQRIELAAAEANHAYTELQNYVGDAELEEKKLLEEARERAATSVDLATASVTELEAGPLVAAPGGPIPSPKDWDPFKS